MPARIRICAVGEQVAMLAGLARLGIDTAPAAELSGAALDAWIDAAEDASFQREFAEFQAQRRAMHTK